ncbi:hypothetical protein EZS27_019272, partial [termite gut metagenome]
KEVITLINTTFIDADVIIQFLHQLKETHRDKPIKIVLDNAKYQNRVWQLLPEVHCYWMFCC